MSGASEIAANPVLLAPGRLDEYRHFKIVPARHLWRHMGTLVAIVAIVAVVNSVLGNPRWEWDVFAEWFLSEPVLEGLGRTLLLTALGAGFGFALGGVLALARMSSSPLLAALS